MVYDVRIMAKAEEDLSEIIMETANFLSGMFKRSFLRESTGIRAEWETLSTVPRRLYRGDFFIE